MAKKDTSMSLRGVFEPIRDMPVKRGMLGFYVLGKVRPVRQGVLGPKRDLLVGRGMLVLRRVLLVR